MRSFLLAAVILFLFGFSLFLYFNHPPLFPDDTPSSENFVEKTVPYQMRQIFFHRYTRYMRDNHGGLLVAEEKRHPLQEGKESMHDHAEFTHLYKYFDKSLALYLTKRFSNRENVGYRIKVPVHNAKSPSPYQLGVEFFSEKISWISVRIEATGSAIRQYEEPVAMPAELEPVDTREKRPSVPKKLPFHIAGKLAIIIDDLGYSVEILQKLVDLNYALTFSILPNLDNTSHTAEIVHSRNFEVLLHLPMQPKGWPKIDPGPGALMEDDDNENLIRKLESNLSSVKYAVGVNNHMGSAFTRYESGLEVVMEILNSKKLFFVDSKTAPGNIARNAAYLCRVPYLSRNVFLDNHQEKEKIKVQLYKAANIARKYGRAIAIGHPYLSTFQVLAENLPLLEKEGVQIVSTSELI